MPAQLGEYARHLSEPFRVHAGQPGRLERAAEGVDVDLQRKLHPRIYLTNRRASPIWPR